MKVSHVATMFTKINGPHITERNWNVNLTVEKKLATSIKNAIGVYKKVDADKDLLVGTHPNGTIFPSKVFPSIQIKKLE